MVAQRCFRITKGLGIEPDNAQGLDLGRTERAGGRLSLVPWAPRPGNRSPHLCDVAFGFLH